jgi:hypothetical protein
LRAAACKIPAMTDMALHYRLLPAALPIEEKRIRSFHIPTLVLVVALSTVVFVALGIRQGATPKSMIPYGSIMAAYIAYLAVWSPRRVRRRLIRCWETYDLEIGHDYLLRRQADIPDLRLQFDEVQAVERVQGRYLRVIGQTKGRAISIPESIDHFDQVLETIGPFVRSAYGPSSSSKSIVPSWQQEYSSSLPCFGQHRPSSSFRYRWGWVQSSCGSSFGFNAIRMFR